VLPAIGDKRRAYPLAVYVPASAPPAKGDPRVIIYLHGKGESEADVIASPYVRSWADATGSVVIAPYAGSSDMLNDATIADLIDVVSAGADSLHVDRRHLYLAGNSLGGFAAFKMLAAEPDHWAAMLVIEGAVAQTDSDSVAAHVQGKPIYLVAGANDPSISPAYIRQLGAWLRTHGALVTYYEQPDGTHSLASVAPIAGKAWRDMVTGVVPASTSTETIPAGETPPPKRP
jgi:predicted esterase